MTLRHAVPEDARAFLKTVQAYIAENEGQVWEPDEFRETEEEERAWIHEMLESPRSILVLAIHNGEIVGNIDFHGGDRHRTAHAGEIGMGMLPAWRSRGLGGALVRAVFDWAAAILQLEKVKLRTLSTNARAIGLYEKLGFREEGRRVREFKYADGTYADEIAMAKFIGPSVPPKNK